MSQTTTTPNYGLIKPNVNSDNDLWGDHWNANADTLDSKIKTIENKAGVVSFNTRSGTVSLLQADVTTVLPPGAGTPAMDGTASAGSLLTWSRSDHVHPVDTSRYAASNPAGYVTAAQAGSAAPVQSVATRTGAVVLTHNDLTDWAATLAPYAPLASPPLTGSPTAPTVTPSSDSSTKLATTAFVQSALGAVPGGAIVSATPPTANPGALWYDSTGGQTYCRYDDGNTVQWVPVSNITGLANAAQLSDVAPAYNNVGRNLLHNPLFNVAQRGVGPFTANFNYTLDRWALAMALDTASINQQAFTPASVPGDEAAANCLGCAFTGNAGPTSQTIVYQPIEDVRRLANKTVTVSFYAICTSGALKLGISLDQNFGTGGSPSAAVNGVGQSVTLNTTWTTRYSLTFTLASIAGKTLGTNNNHNTSLDIWYSAGTSNATRAGSVGVQAGTVYIWGVQLEVGSVATPLEKPDPRYDLANCQRFYQRASSQSAGYGAAAAGIGYAMLLPVQMRASPTYGYAATTQINCSGFNVAADGNAPTAAAYVSALTTATGAYLFAGTFTASADL